MNHLEEQLRQLRPAPLSGRLQQRLAQAVEPPAKAMGWRWPAWAMAAGLATLVLVGSRLVSDWPPPAAPSRPQAASAADCAPTRLRVLCAQRDEGLVLVNANQPCRQVRRRYVELYSWDHCRPGTKQNYSVPTEEVVLLPVAVY